MGEMRDADARVPAHHVAALDWLLSVSGTEQTLSEVNTGHHHVHV